MVESQSDTPSGSWRRIEWTYDAFGRRIQQVTSIWTNNAWFVVENLKFMSDPMLFGRHIAELNATNNTLVRSFAWGLDLSGTMDSAGGVGGLAWVTLHTASGPASGTHFVCYDGNGNIVALISATTGDVTARYEYGPFGEPIRVSGPAATPNPFRFSTKRTDNTTDLVLYEYRAYNPALGCWASKDPIRKCGGLHLYGFVLNNPINYYDLLGLKAKKCKEITRKDGTPFIFFEPPESEGGGWKISRLNFISGGGSTHTFMDGFSVEWSAKVEVYCRCDDGCFEARKGTRIHSKTFDGPDDWFPVYEAGAMPVSIPTPTTFLEAIGEAVATVVDSNLPKPISIATSTANEIAEKIAANRPTKPTDGKWKDKSPCEK